MIHDAQLLQQYAETGSEPAFSELVSQHLDLVYSVAVRLVGGDTHLAQDVTQTVFTDLSLKARSLPRGVMLAGWLHRHTFFVASSMVRTEQRRRNREKQAAQMNTLDNSTEPDWDRLVPLLDQALQGLGTADRNAIILRYFQGRDLKSVGLALGTNEDAAQKRVSRALEKLRSCLSQRGVMLTAASLAVAMTSHAVSAAPAGMAANVAASVFVGTATGSGTTLTWIKFVAWLKTKTVIVSATAVLLTGVATICLLQTESGRLPKALSAETSAEPVSEAKATASAANASQARFGFHWSQVESADYRQYIANLRAIGCPEQTIRDLIIADLNQLFASRMQAIWTPPARLYWKKPRDAKASPDQLKQLAALEQEKGRITKELLGISINSLEMFDLAFLQLLEFGPELLFLPADKREAARQALQETGVGGRAGVTRVGEVAVVQPEPFDEKLKLLASVLSPEELEEFRLRNSPRAQWLRGDVQYFNCMPQEFKALLDLREQHLGPDRKDHLSVDHATAIEQVRMFLGEERAKEYERVSDHGYLNGRRAAERAGFPAELADQVGQIVFEARVAAERTAKNTSLSVEERRRQVQTLQAWAEWQLDTALNWQASPAIRSALRMTLASTAQFIRP
jgi:RNA polymerase sigma factor (sigma-70 family)